MSYSWRGSQSESLCVQLEDSSQSINMMEEALARSTAGWRCQRLPIERGARTQIDSLLSHHGLSVQQHSVLVWWSQPFTIWLERWRECIMAPLCSVTVLWKLQCHRTWSSEPREISGSCYPCHASQQDILLPADAQSFMAGETHKAMLHKLMKGRAAPHQQIGFKKEDVWEESVDVSFVGFFFASLNSHIEKIEISNNVPGSE